MPIELTDLERYSWYADKMAVAGLIPRSFDNWSAERIGYCAMLEMEPDRYTSHNFRSGPVFDSPGQKPLFQGAPGRSKPQKHWTADDERKHPRQSGRWAPKWGIQTEPAHDTPLFEGQEEPVAEVKQEVKTEPAPSNVPDTRGAREFSPSEYAEKLKRNLAECEEMARKQPSSLMVRTNLLHAREAAAAPAEYHRSTIAGQLKFKKPEVKIEDFVHPEALAAYPELQEVKRQDDEAFELKQGHAPGVDTSKDHLREWSIPGTEGGRHNGAIVHPSTKVKGKWQVSRFDPDGFSGDTTLDSREAAVADMRRDGYRPTEGGHLERLAQTDQFRVGNEKSRIIGMLNNLHQQAGAHQALFGAYEKGGLDAAEKEYQRLKEGKPEVSLEQVGALRSETPAPVEPEGPKQFRDIPKTDNGEQPAAERHPWQMTQGEFAPFDDKQDRTLTEEERTLTRAKTAEEKRHGKRRSGSGWVPEGITSELQGKSESKLEQIEKRLAEIRKQRGVLHQSQKVAEDRHRAAVEHAVKTGEKVSDEVLEDYPDLRQPERHAALASIPRQLVVDFYAAGSWGDNQVQEWCEAVSAHS